MKFFYRGGKKGGKDGETQLVGDRAGPEPRSIKGCSTRKLLWEVSHSNACHVCYLGALDGEEASH